MSSKSIRWLLLTALPPALMIVSFVVYEGRISAATVEFVNSDRSRLPVALGLAMLLGADIVLPIPMTIVATASGALLGWPLGAAVDLAGLQLSSVLGYWFGATAGRAAARRMVGPSAIEKAERFNERWGDWSLPVARSVPILAEASVVLAGVAKMPLPRFGWITGLANLALSAVYAGFGAFSLEREAFLPAFAASILLPGAVMLLLYLHDRR